METTYIFHGPLLLGSENVGDLIIDNNPCSDVALEIDRMSGSDFIVNVTIDMDKKITGVFSGDLELAHREAVKKIRQ